MQAAADRVVDDAVAVHENFVSGAMDPVGVLGIAIVERQILPATERSCPRQSDPFDHCEIDQGAAPNDAVAIDVDSIRIRPGQPWPWVRLFFRFVEILGRIEFNLCRWLNYSQHSSDFIVRRDRGSG